MKPEQIEAALTDLGAEARALVELSLIREVADEDIASLLGTDEDAVRSRREDALALLAADLGASSREEVGALVREMRELPAVRWRDKNGEPAPAPAPEPAPAAEAPPPVVQPALKRNRRLAPALLGGVLVAAVVALVLGLSSDGDDEGDGEPAREAVAPAGKRAKLVPLGGGTAVGSAEVSSARLELSARGLPDPGGAGYVVWLYNSISDARPLTRPQRFEKGFDVKATLPQNADRYRFVDVSLELADDNRNHSGESVLRVPLSSLR